MTLLRMSALAAFLLLTVNLPAFAQHSDDSAKTVNLSEVKFAPVPGLPECAPGAVLQGDPGTGASILLGKLSSGCTIPWHWHTPNEHLMLVSGEARIEMRNGKTFEFRPGGFALMPSRHIHQFRCEKECVLYVYSDRALDIRYVDKDNQEITPEAAFRSVKKGM